MIWASSSRSVRFLRVGFRSAGSGNPGASSRSLTQARGAKRLEDQLGLVLVVPPAAQRDVGGGGRPALRLGLDVVELQERPLRAPPAVGRDEGALAAVTARDGALDRAGNVARGDARIRPRTDGSGGPRPRRRGELRLLRLLEEQAEGAVEGGSGIAVRD